MTISNVLFSSINSPKPKILMSISQKLNKTKTNCFQKLLQIKFFFSFNRLIFLLRDEQTMIWIVYSKSVIIYSNSQQLERSWSSASRIAGMTSTLATTESSAIVPQEAEPEQMLIKYSAVYQLLKRPQNRPFCPLEYKMQWKQYPLLSAARHWSIKLTWLSM